MLPSQYAGLMSWRKGKEQSSQSSSYHACLHALLAAWQTACARSAAPYLLAVLVVDIKGLQVGARAHGPGACIAHPVRACAPFACSVQSCVMRGGGQAGRDRVIVPNSLASGQTGMQSACGCISSMQVLVIGLAYIAHSRDQQTGRRDRHPNAPFHHARRPIVPCMCRSIRLNVSNQTQHGSPHRRSPVSSAPSDCRRLAALAAKRNSPPASCIQPLALAQALHGGTVNYKYWRRLQQISASAHVLHRVCS